MGRPRKKHGANTLSRHRARQAAADLAAFGEQPIDHGRRAADPPKKPLIWGWRHCPGTVAYGMLGAGVWRPGSTGLSGT